MDYGTPAYGKPLKIAGRDEIVAFLRAKLGPDMITVHRAGQPEITVDGDTARGTWSFEDTVIATEHRIVIVGAAFYQDRYERGGDGRWRIAHTGYVRTYEAMMSLDDLPSFRITAKLGADAGAGADGLGRTGLGRTGLGLTGLGLTGLGLALLTQPFAEALAEAEKIIAGAPHIACEQDLAEGYDYLAGSIQASLRLAWAYQRDFPYFVQSTGPYTKMGLDNPDTLYFHAYLRDDAEYVVTGRRGTTADLSFQVLKGDYSPVEVPDSLSAFDDRAIDIAADGSFELRFGPGTSGRSGRNYFTLGAGSSMLLVREVYSDWGTERRGTISIRREDRAGAAPPPADTPALAKRYAVAGKILLSRLRTFLAFPEWFYLAEPVNTMTPPRPTPGGLATQFSSAGHFDLAEDQAMIVTVPAAGPATAPYQGIQLGSMWYVSLDYINHQTSLTADQARIDPDGQMRFVISERDPGVANWLELTGHRRGYVQIRWQRLTRDLTLQDGPQVAVIPFAEIAGRLPYYQQARVSPEEWRARIAARQAAVRGTDARLTERRVG